MLAALEAIKEACSMEMSMNTKYTEEEQFIALAESIKEQLCPNECSNSEDETHGHCNNGMLIMRANDR